MIKINDKFVINSFKTFVSSLSAIIAFILVFFDIQEDYRECIFYIFIILCALMYIIIYFYYLNKRKIKLNINNTKVIIKFGDLFKENCGKVIGCNEYFDTIVDDKLISKNSLHGQVINKYFIDTNKLDKDIELDQSLSKNIAEHNESRYYGKKVRFNLGQYIEIKIFIYWHLQDLIIKMKLIYI